MQNKKNSQQKNQITGGNAEAMQAQTWFGPQP